MLHLHRGVDIVDPVPGNLVEVALLDGACDGHGIQIHDFSVKGDLKPLDGVGADLLGNCAKDGSQPQVWL